MQHLEAPNRVRELRNALGLTQATLASRAGIDCRYLRAIESGEQSPTIGVAWKVTTALGAEDVGHVFPSREPVAA